MAGGACRGYGGRGGLGMVVRYGPKVVLRIGIQSLNFPTSFWSGLHLASLWHHARMQQDDEITLAITSASRSALLRAATRLLGPAEAEDAVQDAYVRALEANAQVLNAAQAWLLTVVRNLAIDRLRRRQWMAQWLAEVAQAAQEGLGNDMGMAAPSAEADASLAQQATLALYWLAVCVTPAEGAAVLLHAVFDVSHAELAQARGGTVAASRQQLRRALQRVRQVQDEASTIDGDGRPELQGAEAALLRLYLQSLQSRDPQTLWALLRQPPVSARAVLGPAKALHAAWTVPQTAPCAPSTLSGVVQAGGQLGLVLTLDGVMLCVVPLGPHAAQAHPDGDDGAYAESAAVQCA